MAQERKRGLRVSHWIVTSYLVDLPVQFPKTVRYVIYQREICPETKKEHWQVYIEFFNAKRIGQVKAVLGECHAEKRRGSRTEARDYSRKVESAIAKTQFEWGEWVEEGCRKRKLSDMLKTDMTLKELIDETPHFYVMYHRGLEKLYARRTSHRALEFRKLTVTVYVGATGCGKTRMATSGDDWFILPCSDRLWFDGYDGQQTLILDDFYGGIKYSKLLRILDGHSLQLPVKGGFIWALWTKVIITSNAQPETWYTKGFTPALRRRVTNIIQMQLPDAAALNVNMSFV